LEKAQIRDCGDFIGPPQIDRDRIVGALFVAVAFPIQRNDVDLPKTRSISYFQFPAGFSEKP
jgi:hypothetical protein